MAEQVTEIICEENDPDAANLVQIARESGKYLITLLKDGNYIGVYVSWE
jgi:DNA-binding transcriptional regulator LsrR (DeoR family)